MTAPLPHSAVEPPSAADTAGSPSVAAGLPATLPIVGETDFPPTGPRAERRQVDHLPAGSSRKAFARRLRAERASRLDWAVLDASRATSWWTFAGFGLFAVGGLTGISAPGWEPLGHVYLWAALCFALAFLINLPRLYRQEALYDRWRADTEGLCAIRAALTEGDGILDVRIAA